MRRMYDDETVRAIITNHVAESGLKFNHIARKAHITNAHLSKVLHGKVGLTDNVLLRLQEVLRIKFFR